jgi:hypothetical protein
MTVREVILPLQPGRAYRICQISCHVGPIGMHIVRRFVSTISISTTVLGVCKAYTRP